MMVVVGLGLVLLLPYREEGEDEMRSSRRRGRVTVFHGKFTINFQ